MPVIITSKSFCVSFRFDVKNVVIPLVVMLVSFEQIITNSIVGNFRTLKSQLDPLTAIVPGEKCAASVGSNSTMQDQLMFSTSK